MPGMTGPEVRDVLRENGCEAAVIFVTAHRGEPIAQHLGPELVFFKPIEVDALVRAIADARPVPPRRR
jgi:FixJ family two-component response regulator